MKSILLLVISIAFSLSTVACSSSSTGTGGEGTKQPLPAKPLATPAPVITDTPQDCRGFGTCKTTLAGLSDDDLTEIFQHATAEFKIALARHPEALVTIDQRQVVAMQLVVNAVEAVSHFTQTPDRATVNGLVVLCTIFFGNDLRPSAGFDAPTTHLKILQEVL